MQDDIALAYAAGLFEGEGCVTLTQKRQPCLMVAMTDREPIEQIAAILGGRVYGPYHRAAHESRKPTYEWRLFGWTALEMTYPKLRKWLSPRRRGRFEEILAQAPTVRGSGSHQRTKTHCIRGHVFDAANTYVHGGHRHCRACRRLRKRAST